MPMSLSSEVKEVVSVQLTNPDIKQRVKTSDGYVVMLTPGSNEKISLRIDMPDGCQNNFIGTVEKILDWYEILREPKERAEHKERAVYFHATACPVCGCFEVYREEGLPEYLCNNCDTRRE